LRRGRRLRHRQATLGSVPRRGVRRDGPFDDQRRLHQRADELLMARSGFGARLGRGMCNPWALLLSTFGGALAWALGTPVPLSVGTAVVMLATAAAVGAFTGSSDDAPVQLRRGTRQQELVILLDGHVRSLRALQSKALPGVVQSQTEGALAAADNARPYVVQGAAALEALDGASCARPRR